MKDGRYEQEDVKEENSIVENGSQEWAKREIGKKKRMKMKKCVVGFRWIEE